MRTSDNSVSRLVQLLPIGDRQFVMQGRLRHPSNALGMRKYEAWNNEKLLCLFVVRLRGVVACVKHLFYLFI